MTSSIVKESVIQDWVHDLPFMQQTVLLTSIRGPDNIKKYHVIKQLLYWYRRCILKSAVDKLIFLDPVSEGGGSFMPPSYHHGHTLEHLLELKKDKKFWYFHMDVLVKKYLNNCDEIPHHFQMHFLHASEILGYKHDNPVIRQWWNMTYLRLVEDLHLNPETKEELDKRLKA